MVVLGDEAARHRVGPVAQLRGGVEDALTPFGADLGTVGNHQRPERARDSGSARDVLHHGWGSGQGIAWHDGIAGRAS
jgi:hypothetical protein